MAMPSLSPQRYPVVRARLSDPVFLLPLFWFWFECGKPFPRVSGNFQLSLHFF